MSDKEPVNFTYEKTEAVVYKIRVKGLGWANISLHEWPGGGAIDIQSDFGNYSTRWNAIGDEPFRKFLCRVDRGYFFNACLGNKCKEFDCDATIKAIKERILRMRLDGELDRASSRDLYDLVRENWSCTSHAFVLDMGESKFWKLVNKLYGGDAVDFPFIERLRVDCSEFWRIIWPCAKEIWSRELLELD